jgi:hypothetical protein
MLSKSIGKNVFFIFAGFCFLMFLWIYFFVPETAGKTLEEIDQVFGDNLASHEIAAMDAGIEIKKYGGGH